MDPGVTGASGSGAVPSWTPRVTFGSFALSTVTTLEQGEGICLQDTGTNTWPKSADGPVRLPPLMPSPAFSIPRDGARLCGGAVVPAVQGEGETDGKTSLNVPGVKSIAGYGHARNQPSNRINGEQSRNAAERSRAGASSRGGHSLPPPQHQGAALCLFPGGGHTTTEAGGGLALAAPQLIFHQVAFKRQREGGGRGWGLVSGVGGLLCFILLCNRLITADHAVTI